MFNKFMNEKEIKIDGKRYVLNEDFNGSEPCANCPLKDKCPDAEYYYCKTFIWVKKPFKDVTECSIVSTHGVANA